MQVRRHSPLSTLICHSQFFILSPVPAFLTSPLVLSRSPHPRTPFFWGIHEVRSRTNQFLFFIPVLVLISTLEPGNPGFLSLYADNFTFPCRNEVVVGKNIFAIYIAYPLLKLDLSYNLLEQNVEYAFIFNSVKSLQSTYIPDNGILTYPRAQLNLAGNRMTKLASIYASVCGSNSLSYWRDIVIAPCILLPQDFDVHPSFEPHLTFLASNFHRFLFFFVVPFSLG